MKHVVLTLAVVTVMSALPAGAQKSRRMTADAVKLKGLTLQKTLDADLDGDGRKEVVVIATGPKGIQAALIGENAEGAVVTFVAPPAVGKELAKVEVKKLVPPSESIILEVYDETPDEKVKRVRVYGAGLKEIFSSKIERPRNADERPEWETDKSIIQYGDPRGGWYFEDVQEDGIFEVLVRRNVGAQILRIKKDGEEPVKLLTGVRERAWTWDSEKGRYTEGPERLNDFLPAYTITGVEASSAWVDPKELKELKAKALSEALEQATAKDGTDPSSDKGKGKAKELTDEVKIDLSPYMKVGADQNLATAWIEGDPKGEGKGEWIEVTLEEESDIHMVRLVLGCVDTKQSYKAHNVPEAFTVQLDGGAQHSVNRRTPGKFDGSVVAFTDDLVKLQDRPWARTTLVFFDGKTDAKKVRITLDKAIKQGKGNNTCISEVSVH